MHTKDKSHLTDLTFKEMHGREYFFKKSWEQIQALVSRNSWIKPNGNINWESNQFCALYKREYGIILEPISRD